MPQRFPVATVVRLEENYRSTPEILELANRLVPKLGGAEKVLRATRPAGEAPVLRACEDAEAEVASIVGNIATFHRRGRAVRGDGGALPDQLAVGGLRGGALGGGDPVPGARRRVPGEAGGARDAAGAATARATQPSPNRRGGRAGAGPAAEVVPDGVGEEEQTRQADLARFVRLAEEFGEAHGLAEFLADLQSRFGEEASGRGVNLLTYHRAKGLEFEVVFLPRLEEGELPFKRAQLGEALAEERRLLYVGITRAKRFLSWSAGRAKPVPGRAGRADGRGGAREAPTMPQPSACGAEAWRLERARKDEVPAFVVFNDRTLEEIARDNPRDSGSWRRSRASARRSSSVRRAGAGRARRAKRRAQLTV